MNREQSLKLHSCGRNAWNQWAEELLSHHDGSEEWKNEARADFRDHEFEEPACFRGFNFPGRVSFENTVFLKFAEFYGAIFGDSARFDHACFRHGASFRNTCFQSRAGFGNVAFPKGVWFEGAIFKNDVWFGEAVFKDRAGFERVGFHEQAVFQRAVFEDATWFHQARFCGDTSFLNATFGGDASFFDATYRAEADFRAVRGQSAFRLAGAKFSKVPNFEQSTFVEAPHLDDIEIGERTSLFKGNKKLIARWRALRRLAAQGHAHEQAQRFYAEEMLSRRGVVDRYWSAAFWFGLLYQLFSSFGRSLSRPLLFWVAGLLIFSMLYYLAEDTDLVASTCRAGTNELWSAFGLSLDRSLPALSGFGQEVEHWRSCLGIPSGVAHWIVFLRPIQALFSGTMIFLFLLALRNRFRIK